MPFPARIDPDNIGVRALAVVETQGWDSWSLRDVARDLGVTPTALYRHVGNRAGLHVEIAAAAARALTEALSQPRLPRAGTRRVMAIAKRYVRFGVLRPHAYAAFMRAKPEPDHPRIGPWFELWGLVRHEVAAVVPQSADAAAFALWALLHGRVQLAVGAARAAAPEAGLEDAIRALLQGFEAMGAVRSPLPPPLAQD